MSFVTIKRRVKKNDVYKDITEKAELIKKNARSFIVRLSTGDIIKRKMRDVVNA